MSSYTVTTNFGAKDSLPSGSALKVVKGTELTTEFNNIATAVNSKSNAASPTFTGSASFVNLSVSGTFSGATTIDGGTF